MRVSMVAGRVRPLVVAGAGGGEGREKHACDLRRDPV